MGARHALRTALIRQLMPICAASALIGERALRPLLLTPFFSPLSLLPSLSRPPLFSPICFSPSLQRASGILARMRAHTYNEL